MKTTKLGSKDTRKKQLINLPEEHKAWIARVVELASVEDDQANQTQIIRTIVGQAMREDPESFVARLGKLRLKERLDDLERRSQAIEAEKAALAEQISAGKGQQQLAHSR